MKKLPVLLLLAAGSAFAADDAALFHCRAMAEAGARLACYDAISAGTGTAAAPAVNPAFELKSAARKQPEESVTLETRIAGKFEGWSHGQLIRLENGQVWRVEDDSSETAYLDNPKATLRKGMLGSIYLDIDGARGAPRVRRVQ